MVAVILGNAVSNVLLFYGYVQLPYPCMAIRRRPIFELQNCHIPLSDLLIPSIVRHGWSVTHTQV